jgi:hypothetical protein
MTTTTTTERHPAIASPELDAALERLAFVEATAAADVARVATATANLHRAVTAPVARERAAMRLAAALRLAEQSSVAQPDADGLHAIRAALTAAMRYVTDRTEYGPPSDDPRDRPERLRPTTRPVIEGQARLRHRLADLRVRVAAWHGDPDHLDGAGVVALLADLSDACEAADQFRALVSVTATQEVN